MAMFSTARVALWLTRVKERVASSPASIHAPSPARKSISSSWGTSPFSCPPVILASSGKMCIRDSAYGMLRLIIRTEASHHQYLRDSERISREEKEAFEEILGNKAEDIEDSLRLLSQLLYQHYGQKTVLLIDEYDVPLDLSLIHISPFSGRWS